MKSKKLLSTVVTVGVAASCVAGMGMATFADGVVLGEGSQEQGQEQGEGQEQQQEAEPIALANNVICRAGDLVTFPAGSRVRIANYGQNQYVNFADDTTYTITSITHSTGYQSRYTITFTPETGNSFTLSINGNQGETVALRATRNSGSATINFTALREGWYTTGNDYSGYQTFYYVEGEAVKGLYEVQEQTYFFDTSSGAMLRNGVKWLTVGEGEEEQEVLYAFGSDGIMIKNQFFTVNNNTYFLQSDGSALISSWYEDEVTGDKSYFDEDGIMAKGAKGIDGAIYVFDTQGVMMKNGWADDGDDRYYLQEDGTAKINRWQSFRSYWYYLGADGIMLTDTAATINDNIYVFDDSGKMMKNGFGIVWGDEGVDCYWLNVDGTAITDELFVVDGDTHYFGEDGKMVFDTFKTIDEKLYYFDEYGVMYTDGWLDYEGERYYFESTGAAKMNRWQADSENNTWYYLGADGKALRNTVETINNKIYVFDDAGVMASNGWNGDYYLQADGSAKTNKWQADVENDAWYYLGEDGRKVTGAQTINGKLYIFDSEGVMYDSGWAGTDDGEYYIDADGTAKINRWQSFMGQWYFFGDDGLMVNGESRVIAGTRYVFDYNGVMLSGGLVYINEDTYFVDDNGAAVVNEWMSIDNEMFYFGADGKAYIGIQEIDGKIYYFDAEGIMMHDGWTIVDEDQYFFQEDGTAKTNRWQADEAANVWFFFGEDGKLVTNQVMTISGVLYGFDENGAMLANTTARFGDYIYQFDENGAGTVIDEAEAVTPPAEPS